MELKPCPFCGEKAALYVRDGVQVICLGCYANTPKLSNILTTNGISGNAVQSVIDKWNRRVEE